MQKNSCLNLIPAFLITATLGSCDLPAEKQTAVNKISHVATLGGYMACDTTNYIFIKSSLLNNTTDSIEIVSMTCSWDAAYKIDNTDLELEKNLCYKNGPMIIKIGPRKTFDNFLRLTSNFEMADLRTKSFRVGYNLVVRDGSKKITEQVSQIPDMKNVIWSDTVRLNEFWNY